MQQLPWVISVDDHVVEPPTVWSDRLPSAMPSAFEPLGSTSDRMSAGVTAEKILEAIALPIDIGPHRVVIGASVGIAVGPFGGNTPEQILKNADMAEIKTDERPASLNFSLSALMGGPGRSDGITRRASEWRIQPIAGIGCCVSGI